jgi:hypothetical protein
MADTAVKSLLVEALRAALQTACIDDVDEDDETRAGIVKIGRYLKSPPAIKIYIEVHGEHLLGPEREGRRDTQGDVQRDGYEWQLPPETIGGSYLRWNRGTIMIGYHLATKTRAEAVPIVEVVVSRVTDTILGSASLVGISDTFNAMVHEIEVTNDYVFTNEGSKPATGRAFVDWRALISNTRRR